MIRCCLSEGEASRLALDEQFMNARFLPHQIMRLIELSSADLHVALSARSVGCAFDVNHFAVARAKLRGYENPPVLD
jgi:hypothetical protein